MRERIVFGGDRFARFQLDLEKKKSGCLQAFDPWPEPENIATENSSDPARNKDLHFWKNDLKSNPRSGKLLLEEYFSTLILPGEEPFFQWDFLNLFNLKVPDTVHSSVICSRTWEQTKADMQKQMDSGIKFTLSAWMVILIRFPQAAERSVPWNEFTPETWTKLPEKHLQFADHCSCLEQFLPEQWVKLLAEHPDLESRGACFVKFTEENWIEQILEPFCEKQEEVFRFLSTGRTEGIPPEIPESMAHEFPVHNRNELEILLAIGLPGHLMYWNEYKENRPCRLKKTLEITGQTRGVLLYREQQEQAREPLTGCSSDEAIQVCARNSGGKSDRSASKQVLPLIAKHCDIPLAEAEKLYDDWHYHTGTNIRHRQVAETPYGIYLRALEYLRDKGEISVDRAK